MGRKRKQGTRVTVYELVLAFTLAIQFSRLHSSKQYIFIQHALQLYTYVPVVLKHFKAVDIQHADDSGLDVLRQVSCSLFVDASHQQTKHFIVQSLK